MEDLEAWNAHVPDFSGHSLLDSQDPIRPRPTRPRESTTLVNRRSVVRAKSKSRESLFAREREYSRHITWFYLFVLFMVVVKMASPPSPLATERLARAQAMHQ